MCRKEILVPLYIKGDNASFLDGKDYRYTKEDAIAFAEQYGNAGADAILVFDQSDADQEHDRSIGLLREICRAVDIPVYGGGNIRRMEDVKKLLYAGCKKVFLNYAKQGNVDLTKEVSDRFGRDKMLASVADDEAVDAVFENREFLGGVLFQEHLCRSDIKKQLIDRLKTYYAANTSAELYLLSDVPEEEIFAYTEDAFRDIFCGFASFVFADASFDLMGFKHQLSSAGMNLELYECSMTWNDIKTNSDGMLPVVVQDYRTQEVLMVAYMNQEAFELTVRTGRMTYWSRSRREIWVKGLTSGHFQYVKELAIDCDNDTLLAKVAQIGAACHTGNRTCFYRSIQKKDYDASNPMKVFQDVYAVIEDRKLHPKEGSYTNYLFDKGIDKILKKLGEEATEIVIAAKNPDPEEIKYEISDFLYHAMVLMVERGVTWEDITKELAHR